jgi:hypothetical protein
MIEKSSSIIPNVETRCLHVINEPDVIWLVVDVAFTFSGF